LRFSMHFHRKLRRAQLLFVPSLDLPVRSRPRLPYRHYGSAPLQDDRPRCKTAQDSIHQGWGPTANRPRISPLTYARPIMQHVRMLSAHAPRVALQSRELFRHRLLLAWPPRRVLPAAALAPRPPLVHLGRRAAARIGRRLDGLGRGRLRGAAHLARDIAQEAGKDHDGPGPLHRVK